jgi:hypothetical protein
MKAKAAKTVKQVVPICPACKRIYCEVEDIRREIDKAVAELQGTKKDLKRYYYGGMVYAIGNAADRIEAVHQRLVKLDREEENARHQASMPTHHESAPVKP